MNRILATIALGLTVSLSTAACSDDPAGSGAAADIGAGTASDPFEVTIEGDTVTPSGARVEATVGEPISVHVTSDRAGELHVHSSPEQELDYDEGETTLTITIDSPGVVDVEDHVAEVVVLQVETDQP